MKSSEKAKKVYRWRPENQVPFYFSPIALLGLLIVQLFFFVNIIVGLALDGCLIGCFVLWRASLPLYTIAEDRLRKTKGNKILFEIEKEDIQKILIKKIRWWQCLVLWVGTLLGGVPGPVEESYYTRMAIVFDTCVIDEEDGKPHPPYIEEDTDAFQHVIVFSYRRCLKACEQLGIEPVIV